jgi:erythromycin esterase
MRWHVPLGACSPWSRVPNAPTRNSPSTSTSSDRVSQVPIGPGKALLTLEAVKGPGIRAAADTVSIGGATAGADRQWARYELTIRVPAQEVHSFVITAALQGSGTAWFDDLVLRVDGAAIAALPGSATPPSATELAWLGAHATPLHFVRAPSASVADDTDLGLFADIVGDARIVALGESTHGTREFFLVKHRLLEFLVRELGFTVFAIEANQLAVEKINRYVQGGDGTAREVMRAMFRVWNTEEMLELVEWMRAYNAAHPHNTVRFAGYDMQDHRNPADTLRAFLERTEPTLVPRFDQLVGEYRAQRSSATPEVSDTTRARWRRQGDTLWSEVSGGRSTWLAGSGSRGDSLAVEWAVQAANLFRQAATFNEALSSPDRDSLMAANLDWTLRTLAPGGRVVVWAHDVHVSRGGDPDQSFNGGAQMGAYLSRIYGDAYRAFSLLTYDGAYTATRSFTDHRMIAAEAFPGPSGSLEASLHVLRRPTASFGFVVDLRPARTDDGGKWLRSPRPIRHVGYAAYDYGFEINAVLPLEFDGVVFIDHTTPSRLLR